jgi:hypothetical protein
MEKKREESWFAHGESAFLSFLFHAAIGILI